MVVYTTSSNKWNTIRRTECFESNLSIFFLLRKHRVFIPNYYSLLLFYVISTTPCLLKSTSSGLYFDYFWLLTCRIFPLLNTVSEATKDTLPHFVQYFCYLQDRREYHQWMIIISYMCFFLHTLLLATSLINIFDLINQFTSIEELNCRVKRRNQFKNVQYSKSNS